MIREDEDEKGEKEIKEFGIEGMYVSPPGSERHSGVAGVAWDQEEGIDLYSDELPKLGNKENQD